MILRFLLWKFITRWLPGQVEALFLCKVRRSMGISFSYNVYPNCRFWILQEMSYFLVHHFLSFVQTFSDTCLLNFSKLFINRANLQKCSPASKTWKIWPISLKGMKPSFGFCYIYSPGLGTKWSLRKDIKTVFKWGPPKQSKVLVTSHKIYKQLIIQVNRQSGNWVLNFYILVIEYLLCIG